MSWLQAGKANRCAWPYYQGLIPGATNETLFARENLDRADGAGVVLESVMAHPLLSPHSPQLDGATLLPRKCPDRLRLHSHAGEWHGNPLCHWGFIWDRYKKKKKKRIEIQLKIQKKKKSQVRLTKIRLWDDILPVSIDDSTLSRGQRDMH